MIGVVILQQPLAGRPAQVAWKGQAKVLRCVKDGVVLNVHAGGASWLSKLWGNWGAKHVVPRWIQKSLSVPYCDLTIDLDPVTGTKWLVIDAATWKRSPEELTQKKEAEGNVKPATGRDEKHGKIN